VDIGIVPLDEDEVVVKVYDPKSNKLLFWGKMRTCMYNKDLGIE